MGISFLIFFLSALSFCCFTPVSAFSLEAPERSMVNENVSVTIRDSSQTTSDVKIFVSENATIISQIYAGGWKNAFYYLPGAFPEQKEFVIRIRKPAPHATLCARLRPRGAQKYEEFCMPFVIEVNVNSRSTTEAVASEKHSVEAESAPSTLLLAAPPQTIETKEYLLQRSLVIITFVTALLTLAVLAALFLRKYVHIFFRERRI